jgi:hypothetical protein
LLRKTNLQCEARAQKSPDKSEYGTSIHSVLLLSVIGDDNELVLAILL